MHAIDEIHPPKRLNILSRGLRGVRPRHAWLPALAVVVWLPACDLSKDDAGDDGETAAATATSGAQDSGAEGSTGGGAPPAPGSASATSTTGGDPGPPSGGVTSSATATSGGGDGPGDPGACGVIPAPEGVGNWEYQVDCAGGCSFGYVVLDPIDNWQEIGECLCDQADCGEPVGGEAEAGGVPDMCIEIQPNDGPGYYEAMCECESCTLNFDDIHPDSAAALFEGELDACDCLCLEAGCGYSEGGGGEVGGDGFDDGDPGPTSDGGETGWGGSTTG